MRKKIFLIIIVHLACGGLAAYKWPDEIKRCTLDGTDFDKCLMDAATDAIPKLAKGSKKMGIPPLDPFKFVNLSISSDRPLINLDFEVPEGTIAGGTKLKLKNISYDKIKNILTFDTDQENVIISGNYKLRGKLFVLNIKSSGDFKLVVRNLEAHSEVNLIPTKKEDFYKIDIIYKIKRLAKMEVNFEDSILPPLAEDAMNVIMNDNWRSVSEAFFPTMEKSMSKIYKQVMSPMFKRFSLSTILPPHDDDYYDTESERDLEAPAL